METIQAPHEKLTDKEIKVIIRCLCFSIHLLKKGDTKMIESIEKDADALNKHFNPENFSVMKVSIKELSELMAEVDEKSNI